MSCVAEYRVGFPVYGENGSLKLLQSLNPHLMSKQTIELGDVIIFPTDLEASRFTKSDESKPSGYCLSKTKGKYFIGKKGRIRASASVPEEEKVEDSHSHTHAESHIHKANLKERSSRSFGVYQNVIEARVKSGGQLAEGVSQENTFLKGSYQFARGNWWLGASGEYHIQKYEAELSPTFTWNDKTPRIFKLSLLADYERARWSTGFSLDYNQEVFIYEENQEISLKEIFILGVSLRAKYQWLDRKQWSSSVGLNLSSPFRGSDELNPKGSLGYLAFFDLRRDRVFGDYDFSTRIFYGAKKFENSQNTQEERFVGLQFSISWLEGV